MRETAASPWSAAERLAHGHLRAAGITGWVANPPIRLRCGVRYPDIAIEDIKLAIEIDGRQHHSDPQRFEQDRQRRNAFVKEGWTVLQFTWKVINEEPDKFIRDITETIDRLRSQLRN